MPKLQIRGAFTHRIQIGNVNLGAPVWMKVCFFMSDFWWNLFPQYWHG